MLQWLAALNGVKQGWLSRYPSFSITVVGVIVAHAYETVNAARSGIGRYLEFYNCRPPHITLDGKMPDAFYFANLPALQEAA